MASPTQMHQVLMNLCVQRPRRHAERRRANGFSGERFARFAPSQFNLRRRAASARHDNGRRHRTGSGIPAEIREQIFDPFSHDQGGGKRDQAWAFRLRLGIVKSHGGFINVYSEPTVGAVFKVYIPAVVGVNETSGRVGETPLPRGNGLNWRCLSMTKRRFAPSPRKL